MGLGPAVCEKCQVLAEYSTAGIPNPKNPYNTLAHWYCPICGNLDPRDSAGFDMNHYKQLERNEEFLRFITGKLKDNNVQN